MGYDEIKFWLVTTIGSLMLGVISFFLKRTIVQSDTTAQDVKRIDEQKASRAELTTARDGLQGQLSKLSLDIETIKSDYITKADFFREQAKTDRKLDRIMDILLEMKGEQNNGNG